MKNQKKTIKELAQYFDQELQTLLPISVLPNGALVYKDYLVKQLPNDNWGVINVSSKELKEKFHLKSCALIAAKAYTHKHFNKGIEIKELDNNYWVNHLDVTLYKNIINKANAEQYPILLTRLEESDYRTNKFKNNIYKLFTQAFV